MQIKHLFFGALLLIGSTLFGQIQHGGTPYSFTHEVSKEIPTITMPSFDLQAMVVEDEILYSGKGQPLRFGKEFDVDYNLENSGQWIALPDGGQLWRLEVHSPGARSLNFLFDQFYLPEGGELFIYTPDHEVVLGSFNHTNNKPYNKFSTTVIKGSTAIFEYYNPPTDDNVQIQFSQIVHGYRDFYNKELKDYDDSGACNNNVNCSEASEWQNQKRAVAMIIEGGSRSCSGAMINNTSGDNSPYLLTAYHCGQSFFTGELEVDIIENWIFMFNYESPDCTNQDGPTNQTISGCTIKASGQSSDFLLVELSSTPPESYDVYLAGWNKENIPANSVTTIHHPSGDIKKITFDNTGVSSSNSGGPLNTHWEISEWEDGTTEGGSSGSPLFDSDGYIIGNLTGGTASCSSSTEDLYGKLSYSWQSNGSTPSERLRDWLDPQNSGVNQLAGTNLFAPELALDASVSQLITGVSDITCETTINLSFNLGNSGNNSISSVSYSLQIDNQATQYFTWTGNIPSFFSETIELESNNLTLGEHEISVTLTEINGLPTDENEVNNQSFASIEIVTGQSLFVDITTDEYAEETRYTITTQEGELIVEELGLSSENTVVLDYCLAVGECYVFTIFDSFGDGICCEFGEGSYALSLDSGSGSIELGGGGDFASADTIEFCLEATIDGKPVSVFYAEETTQICQEESIQFTNQSFNEPTDFVWTFIGGEPSTSTTSNPTVTYTAAGAYDVQLIANGAVFSDTLLLTDYIKVFEFPDGTFEVIDVDGIYPGSISFTPSNPIYTWTWENGSSNSPLTNLSDGDYSLILTDPRSECQTSLTATVDLLDTSIESLGFDLVLYPNPTTDVIIVRNFDALPFEATLLDVSGKTVLTQTLETSSTANIAIPPSVADGLYLLKLVNEDKQQLFKVQIVR